MGWSGPVAGLQMFDQARRLAAPDPPERLHRGDVTLPAPQGNPEPLTDRVACALAVRMGMGERVRGHRPPVDLSHDPLLALPGGGVDEHVPDQVYVDRVGRAPMQLVHALGEFLHEVLCARAITSGTAPRRTPARRSTARTRPTA